MALIDVCSPAQPISHVIDHDGRLSRNDVVRLLAPGCALCEGFAVGGGWDLRNRACVGPVLDASDVADALLAAVRGALLVVSPLDESIGAAFLDDLQRLAFTGGAKVTTLDARPPRFEGQLDALLRGLAEGLAMPDAARRALMSSRTAHRRLAEARLRTGVPSTSVLVAMWAHERSRA